MQQFVTAHAANVYGKTLECDTVAHGSYVRVRKAAKKQGENEGSQAQQSPINSATEPDQFNDTKALFFQLRNIQPPILSYPLQNRKRRAATRFVHRS